MYGLGYRTVAARAMAGRALTTAGVGAALSIAGPGAIGLAASGLAYAAAGRLAYAAAGAALDALEPKLPAISRGLQSFAGFAGRGGPAPFLLGALLGTLAAYLAYQLANRGDGYTTSFAGFTPVLLCANRPPSGRDPLGNPAFCDMLQVPDKSLNAPYDNAELLFGFQTMWPNAPLVNRWATVTKYQANGQARASGPMPVDQRTYSDEMIAAGAAVASELGVNPWPDEESDGRRGPVPGVLPKPIGGVTPAIPPSIDPDASPPGRIAPNPNLLVLPYRLVVNRRDDGNPYRVPGYTWTAGPRPGEFRPPAAFPLPGIRVPAVTVDDRGNQAPGRVNPNTRPFARMHERKVKAQSHGAAQQAYMSMFGAMTEIGEFVDSIYDALPESIRRSDYFANGRHELARDKKLWSIYQNYKAIDVDAMVKNIVFNNLQDAVIGKASRDITSASGGSPIGRTLGFF